MHTMDDKAKQLLEVISNEQKRHGSTAFGSLKDRLASYESVADAWRQFREHRAKINNSK